MTLPTWSGWPGVIAAQNADVSSTEPVYQYPWNDDDRDWVPAVLDSGIQWSTHRTPTDETVTIDFENLTMDIYHSRLWHPVPIEEDTQWLPIPYPK